MLVPLCWVALRRERGVFRWLNVGVIAGAFLIEVLTASRSGFLCLAAALACTGLWLSTSRARIALLATTTVVVVLVLSAGESVLVDRLASMRDPETAASGRLELQQAAVLYISRHPWYGGDFRAEVFRYLREAAPDSRISTAIGDNVWDTQSGPHNGYLNVLAEHGIPVGALFIGYFAWLFVDLFRTARRVAAAETRLVLRAACISVGVFGLYMFFDHSYWALSYMLLVGILECGLNLARVEHSWMARRLRMAHARARELRLHGRRR
jgi:O-antigen ligase